MVVASAVAPPDPESAAGESSLRKEERKLSSGAGVAGVADEDGEDVAAEEGEGEGPEVELKSAWELCSCWGA